MTTDDSPGSPAGPDLSPAVAKPAGRPGWGELAARLDAVEAELDALRACLARRRQTGRPALPAAAAARLATLAERARGLAAEAAAVPTAGFDAALAPLDTDGDTDDPTADAIDDL